MTNLQTAVEALERIHNFTASQVCRHPNFVMNAIDSALNNLHGLTMLDFSDFERWENVWNEFDEFQMQKDENGNWVKFKSLQNIVTVADVAALRQVEGEGSSDTTADDLRVDFEAVHGKGKNK